MLKFYLLGIPEDLQRRGVEIVGRYRDPDPVDDFRVLNVPVIISSLDAV